MPIVLLGVVLLLLALAEEHPLRHGDLRGRQRPGGRARRRRQTSTGCSFFVYVIAGGCLRPCRRVHQRADGRGDPLVGNPLLLSDVRRRRGRRHARSAAGAAVRSGSIIGAYILMIVVNILLVLNVSAYYSTIAEGVILMLAVLAGSTPPQFARWRGRLRAAATPLHGLARRHAAASQVDRGDRRLRLPASAQRQAAASPSPCRPFWSATPRRCATRCRPMSCFVLVVIVDAALARQRPRSTGTTGTR